MPSTASGVCTVLDMVLAKPGRHSGFTTQESFSLQEFLDNRFGVYYRRAPARSHGHPLVQDSTGIPGVTNNDTEEAPRDEVAG